MKSQRACTYLVPLLLLLAGGMACHAQTLYTVVLGNQNHVVGSSTLESGLFRSEDQGKTWQQLGPRNLKAYAMDAVIAEKGRVLFIAAGNGIHRSLDSGKTWKIVTGWKITEVLDVAVDQDDPRFIYAGTAFGLWWSQDGGDSWQQTQGPLGREYIYRLHHSSRGSSRILSIVTDRRQLPTYSITSDSGPVRPWLIRESDQVLYLPDPVGVARSIESRQIVEYDSCAWENAYTVVYANPGYRNLRARTIYADSNRVMESVGASHGNTGPCTGLFVPVGDPLPSVVHALVTLRDPWPYGLIAGTFGDGLFAFDDGAWRQIGLPGAQVWSIEIFDF